MNDLQSKIEQAVELGICTFGVRVMTDTPSGKPVTLLVGDDVNNSFEWVDGEHTDDELDGVSTIGFDVDQIDGEIDFDSYNSAIKMLDQYGDGQVVVVGGQHNIDAIHNDIGEYVINSAVVISIVEE